ncbi:MAG: M35 family metallo-endopeptidase [Polyangiaceae bacterium]
MKFSFAIVSVALLLSASSHAEPLTPEHQLDSGPTEDVFAAAGPVVASSCSGHNVPSWLSNAGKFASSASARLNSLNSMSEASRKAAWDSGDETRWFGSYSNSRFGNVRSRMAKISSILQSSKLDVKCNFSKSNYGDANPGIYKIALGSLWRDDKGTADKVQTFVHEGAHIAGAVLGGEARNKYGVSDALTRATKHPGTAVRTAENLGYYAICRSTYWKGKGGCP